MAIFSNIRSLLELEVNGQAAGEDEDDFGINDENPTPDNPSEVADDAAKEDTGEDDDYTLDEEENDDPTEENEDDNFDISEDDGTEETEEGGEEGSEESADNGNKKQTPSDPSDMIDDDEQRATEEAIYDSLTDDQKRIRILQLKLDYKDLYETLINTLEGINQIPKNMNNLESLKRLNILLTKAKTILISYIDNNFDKNSYLENYTTYLKYVAIFRTTAKVIEEINESVN